MNGKMDSGRRFLLMILKMKKYRYDKEIISAKEWVQNTLNIKFQHDDPIRELNSFLLKEHSLDAIGSAATDMHMLGFWHLQNALCVIDSDVLEFQEKWIIYIAYARYSYRIRIFRIEHPEGNGSIASFEMHRHFNLLLGSGLFEDALWLGQRIYDSINKRVRNPVVYELHEISEEEMDRPITDDNDPRNLNRESISGYSESPLCGFVLRMWLILAGRRQPQERLPAGAPQCGVYAPLFDYWDSPEKLYSAIIEACDFHVRRMKEDRRIHHDIAEFTMSPFRQIPFEILAYRNLRKSMGLDTPWPAHPLLDSPFVTNLPEKIAPSEDPLLKEVLVAVRKVLPEV